MIFHHNLVFQENFTSDFVLGHGKKNICCQLTPCQRLSLHYLTWSLQFSCNCSSEEVQGHSQRHTANSGVKWKHWECAITFSLSLDFCPTVLSVTMIKHWSKASWGRRDLFHLSGYSPLLREGQAGAWRGMLFTGLLFWVCSALPSYTNPHYLLRDGAAHSGLGPPPLISNQIMLHNMPTSLFDGGKSSFLVPSS